MGLFHSERGWGEAGERVRERVEEGWEDGLRGIGLRMEQQKRNKKRELRRFIFKAL